MTLPTVLAIAGCFALLIALFGGGVKAKEIEVPEISAWQRIISGLVGAVLIGIALWASFYTPPVSQPTSPQPSETPTQNTIPSPTQSNPIASQTPNPPPTISVNGLIGIWQGSGQQVFNGVSNVIFGSFTFNAPCSDGPICVDGSIQNLPCSFYLSFLSENNGKYYFQQENKDGNCGIVSLTYIQRMQNGKLLYHSEGSRGIEEMTLTGMK